jgi:hypothetical protein
MCCLITKQARPLSSKRLTAKGAPPQNSKDEQPVGEPVPKLLIESQRRHLSKRKHEDQMDGQIGR